MNVSALLNEISEAIFPSNIYCEVCGALIDRSRPYSLCDNCVKRMHWITGGALPDGSIQRTCRVCGKVLPETYCGEVCYDCMEIDHYFVRGWSCLTYGLHERELMMGIKYSGKGYLAVKMGDVLFDRMEMLIGESYDRGFLPFDTVVPVPVSEKRLARRGYNQSELMARQFTKRWIGFARDNGFQRLPVFEKNVLIRQKETAMLRSMNPAERRLALKGAFAVRAETEPRIIGKNVLLIDDIYTTGSTVDACSRVLLDAGAEAVYLLTLCTGGNRQPKREANRDDEKSVANGMYSRRHSIIGGENRIHPET